MAKPRKMLSNWEAPCIQSLMRLIETQSKVTLAHWALDYSEEYLLPLWLKDFPQDLRPQEALDAAREWLKGHIKLTQAKPIILHCHAAAREAENSPIAQASARAIGQSASTIHSATHCIGLAFYGALALAYAKVGINAPWTEIEAQAATECALMEEALQGAIVKDEPNPAKINWRC